MTTDLLQPTAPVSPISTVTPASYKSKDMELYNRWNTTKSKSDMTALVSHLQPLIFSEVRKLQGTLPEAALLGESKKWTVHAIKTYDPSKGAGLSTHVVNYLQKVKRLNYNYQNAARLPENLHLEWQNFSRTKSHLQDSLNREPTDAELAKELGWSEPQVVKFSSRLYEDLSESAATKPLETSQFNRQKVVLDYIRSQLDSTELFIFEHKDEISASEMCERLGVNISRYNYLQGKLIKKVDGILKEFGNE